MAKSKKDLIELVAEKNNITKKEATDIVNSTLETIVDLASEDRLTLSGFGTFKITTSKERTGINPSTKEKIVIPSSNKLAFKQSSEIKEELNK